jgi:hypothetical protein
MKRIDSERTRTGNRQGERSIRTEVKEESIGRRGNTEYAQARASNKD